MYENNQERQEEWSLLKDNIKVIGLEDMQIPICCREGWESCKHGVKREKPPKRNIGL